MQFVEQAEAAVRLLAVLWLSCLGEGCEEGEAALGSHGPAGGGSCLLVLCIHTDIQSQIADWGC